jgi:hypothetical protein
MPPTTLPPQHLRWWVYALVVAIALVVSFRRNDFSPVVHPDTAFEEALVQECLRDDACTTLGGGASFRNIFHMVGWLNFMTFAEWTGLGRDAIHRLIQVANASKIVLAMLVADRLGGAPAAALTPYFAFRTGAAPGALYDSSLMAFFGTVLLVQCVAAAVARPPMRLLVLAALTAAVIAEVHLAGGMALLSVVWVAGLHPPDRIRRMMVVVTAFVVAFLAISPKTVAWDLVQLFSFAGADPAGVARSGDSLAFRLHTAANGVAFLAPWVLHRILGSWLGRPPRGLQGALAVSVPVAIAYAVGVGLGVLPWTSTHYLEHAYPAIAVVLAVPCGLIASRVWESAASALRVSTSLGRAALWIVPLYLSLNAAWTQPSIDRLRPHWTDVHALARLLHDDWQWDWATIDRELRSPEKALVLADLSAAVPGWETAGPMELRRFAEPVAIIAVETNRVPDPLPGEWIAVSQRTFSTVLAIPTRSSLQWDDESACVEEANGRQTCFDSPIDPQFLWRLESRIPEIRRLVRRVPWNGAPGTTEVILMPDLPLSCVGRIVEGPAGTEIDSGGRSARVTMPGTVVFEWIPNTPSCGIMDFLKQDRPPFVLAGEAHTVELMSQLIDRGRR